MEENTKYISVRFETTNKSYTFSVNGQEIKNGDMVVVETQRGLECGQAVSDPFDRTDITFEIKPVIRKALVELDGAPFAAFAANTMSCCRVCSRLVFFLISSSILTLEK